MRLQINTSTPCEVAGGLHALVGAWVLSPSPAGTQPPFWRAFIRRAASSFILLSSAVLLLSVGFGSERQESISGRVMTESGRPLSRATVRLKATKETFAFGPQISCDEEGKFRFHGVAPGSYRLEASAPGFVQVDRDEETNAQLFYHPGDSAELVMTKGGIITGTVTDSTGRPAIEAKVRAVRIGRRAREEWFPERHMVVSITDDRGVYRLFGLHAGSYLVSAGGRAGGNARLVTAHDDSVSTPFSQNSSGTHSQVVVNLGSETGGIDIQLGASQGSTISGMVKPSGLDLELGRTWVTLSQTGAGTIENFAIVSKEESSFRFSLEKCAGWRLSVDRAK